MKIFDKEPQTVLDFKDPYIQFGDKRVGKVVSTFKKDGALYADVEILDYDFMNMVKAPRVGISDSKYGHIDEAGNVCVQGDL